MSSAWFVVIQSQGKWWVDFEGKAHGPFSSRDAAGDEARHVARFSAHIGRKSEVLVPDETGRYRVVWTSADDWEASTEFSRAAE